MKSSINVHDRSVDVPRWNGDDILNDNVQIVADPQNQSDNGRPDGSNDDADIKQSLKITEDSKTNENCRLQI